MQEAKKLDPPERPPLRPTTKIRHAGFQSALMAPGAGSLNSQLTVSIEKQHDVDMELGYGDKSGLLVIKHQGFEVLVPFGNIKTLTVKK